MTYIPLSDSYIHTLTLRQVYMNVVLDDALEDKPGGEKERIGMVVIRGNAVVMIEVRTHYIRSISKSLTCG